MSRRYCRSRSTGEVRKEILQLVAMNQLDLVAPLIASDDERAVVDRIAACLKLPLDSRTRYEAAHDFGAAFANAERFQYLPADRHFFDRICCQRNADRIADALR